MSIITVTKGNFDSEVANSERPVLIDFWASWCGACRMLAPVIAEIAQERDDIKVCKINVDEQPELSQRFEIFSIPTLVAMDGKNEKKRAVGVIPKEQILSLF